MGHQLSCHTAEAPAVMLTPCWGWERYQLPEQEGFLTQWLQKQGGSCQDSAGVT